MDRLRASLRSELARVPAPSGLVEELTDRERDVLRLLPSRLTLREIATELFVSQNTLKFHLRVIYRKLGVNSRAEAVETARRCGPRPGLACDGQRGTSILLLTLELLGRQHTSLDQSQERLQLVDPSGGTGRAADPRPPPGRAGDAGAAGRRADGGRRQRAS